MSEEKMWPVGGLRRVWWEVRIAVQFLHALRTANHPTLSERVADAAAVLLTRSLRCMYPNATFPFTVDLTKAHARDVESNRKDGSSRNTIAEPS